MEYVYLLNFSFLSHGPMVYKYLFCFSVFANDPIE